MMLLSNQRIAPRREKNTELTTVGAISPIATSYLMETDGSL